MAERPRELESDALELDHFHTSRRRSARTSTCRSRGKRFARRRTSVRSFALVTTALGVMIGGGAIFSAAGGSPAPRDPAANSVRPVAGAPSIGTANGMALNADLVDLASTPSGRGYWAVASDGGVFGFGDAAFHG